MTATPIAMHDFGHSSSDTATVIQWHVLGMFLPSFFTGTLIQKFGVHRIILTGVFTLFTYLIVALFRGSLYQFYSRVIYCWARLEFLVYRRIFSTYKSLQT